MGQRSSYFCPRCQVL
ncbi:zinc finger domain-containing protein [Corynebacterium aquatimens]